MKSRRTIILLAVILVINFILAVVFRDLIRENVLIPILYLIWYLRLFLKSLGETCLWPLFVILLAVVSLLILRKKKKDSQRVQDFGGEVGQLEDGRVAFWMKYIRRKWMGIENLNFVSFRLRELTLSTLAYQENLTSSELELELIRGELNVPEEVKVLLQPRDRAVNNITEPSPLFSRIINWFKVRSINDIHRSDSEMSKLVQFLEDQLEIKHDHGNQ